MDYGGLNKLIMLMKIWWLTHVLLDIVDVLYNKTIFLEMCAVLHISMVTLIDSVSVRGKVRKLKCTVIQ